MFRAARPPLTVTDLKMPVMTGIELLQQVREVDPDAAVIVLTGAADVKTAIESLKLGAYDFIMKPVNVDELLIAADRALERRQLLLERRQYHAMLESRVEQATHHLAAAYRELESTYRTTLEALGSALDTRDVGTESHSRRVHGYALATAREYGIARGRAARPRPRRAAARHRQDRHPRRHPAQAGPAHARRVGDHAHPPGDRPPPDREDPVPARRAPDRLRAPRKMGRQRLPARHRRRGHPRRRPHLLGGRRLRRDDVRPALLQGHPLRRRQGGAQALRRARTSTPPSWRRSCACRSSCSRRSGGAAPSRERGEDHRRARGLAARADPGRAPPHAATSASTTRSTPAWSRSTPTPASPASARPRSASATSATTRRSSP